MRALKNIGFIGVGRMGSHMAGHLVCKGYRVLPFDISGQALENFCDSHGVGPCTSLSELGRKAEVVITMLPTSKIVRDVLLGSDTKPGLAASMQPGAVLMDMSTSNPHDTRRLAAELAARDIAMVDAPVAGGVVFARDATLDILTGGCKNLLNELQPLLLAMGRKTLYCGPIGAAHAMKALNNFVNAAVLAVYLEALVAGRKFGIDHNTMITSLEAATLGRNHPYEKKIKGQIFARSFNAGMAMSLIAKDVGIAVSLAESEGLRCPMAARTLDVWLQASAELGPDSDQTEIVRFWEEPAELVLENP